MTQAEIEAREKIASLGMNLTPDQIADAAIMVGVGRISLRRAVAIVTQPKRRVTWRRPEGK